MNVFFNQKVQVRYVKFYNMIFLNLPIAQPLPLSNCFVHRRKSSKDNHSDTSEWEKKNRSIGISIIGINGCGIAVVEGRCVIVETGLDLSLRVAGTVKEMDKQM